MDTANSPDLLAALKAVLPDSPAGGAVVLSTLWLEENDCATWTFIVVFLFLTSLRLEPFLCSCSSNLSDPVSSSSLQPWEVFWWEREGQKKILSRFSSYATVRASLKLTRPWAPLAGTPATFLDHHTKHLSFCLFKSPDEPLVLRLHNPQLDWSSADVLQWQVL